LTQISVIIVSFNAPCFLQVCLESVQATLVGLEGEVIVVDNASQGDTVAMIRTRFPEVMLVANSENIGFARAVNQGSQLATGEYILVLNPDSVVPEDGLRNILRYAGRQEKLGAIGCRFIDGAGELLPECKRNFPGIRSAVFKLLGLSRGYYADHLDAMGVGQVEVLSGAFMLIKRKLFIDLKGFDERFFMFGEDIDLSYRIHRAGYRNRYYGQMTIIHFKGESTLKDPNYLKNFYGALEIFYIKHYRPTALGRSLMRLLVAGAIWLRSRREHFDGTFAEPVERFVYCGKRKPVYNALKSVMNAAASRIEPEVQNLDFETESLLLYDSDSIAYSDIMVSFDQLPVAIRKRIISRSGDFFIGSDDPSRAGQCLSFRNSGRKPNPDVDCHKPVRSGH
jgi:GT2 family glycosyltransferase